VVNAKEGENLQCEICAAGRYQNQSHININITCTLCQAGRYIYDNRTLDTEHIACNFCPLGHEYVDRTTKCTLCSAGKYQQSNNTVAAFCDFCPTGQYLLDDAQNVLNHDSIDDCKICLIGHEFIDQTTNCSICPAGRYQNSSNAVSAFCEFCPSGQYLLDDAQDALNHDNINDCVICGKVGYEYVSKTQECIICGGGRYQGRCSFFFCPRCILTPTLYQCFELNVCCVLYFPKLFVFIIHR
jgi:hypothetical protein